LVFTQRYIFFLLAVLGFKHGTSHLLGRYYYLSHSTSPFLCWVFSR
jgi:hypothetical protein